MRGLTTGTIEGHLAHYISTGKLSLNEFVPTEKIRRIQAVLPVSSMTEAKEKLGEDISYGEIRMVIAANELTSKNKK